MRKNKNKCNYTVYKNSTNNKNKNNNTVKYSISSV
jgi:hypothetical protein